MMTAHGVVIATLLIGPWGLMGVICVGAWLERRQTRRAVRRSVIRPRQAVRCAAPRSHSPSGAGLWKDLKRIPSPPDLQIPNAIKLPCPTHKN